MTKKFNNLNDMLDATLDKTQAREVKKKINQRKIARALTILRNKKGVTQKEIAEKLGVTQATISKIESTDDFDLNFGHIVKYSKALNLSVNIDLVRSNYKVVDRIKHHWFKITKELETLRAIAKKDDKQINQGIESFNKEFTFNFILGLGKHLSVFEKYAKKEKGEITVEDEVEDVSLGNGREKRNRELEGV